MPSRKWNPRLIIVLILAALGAYYLLSGSFDPTTITTYRLTTYRPKNPILKQGNSDTYDEPDLNRPRVVHNSLPKGNPVKATFVVLVRNGDVHNIRLSIRQLEDRFNRKYNYPYVFLNDEEFTEEFKEMTSAIVSGKTYYGKVEGPMWSYPEWINVTKADNARAAMEAANVIYGGSLSYRNMCRFQSGWFFRHPLLDQFDYYWRVEPSVDFYCDLDYDVFQFMHDNKLKYGWTLSLHEYRETIPTLWETTREFMRQNPEYIISQDDPGSLMNFVTEDSGNSYNGCHFWSNFEIGSIKFLRSEQYLSYFNFLDRAGGFFYERWGDAPVHSLAVAMFLRRSEVHFFNDIGYKHNPFIHCPQGKQFYSKCHCNPRDNFDLEGFSCTQRWHDVTKGKETYADIIR
ncbi:glycolipid 2-alpha-mannosyltransferase [Endogone sp. FLAS-F59071]|nr:glycolipid 2-alpha-mannosyltransferase [Endogone sp. FLAS-F59071]|eukprot:RUS16107.1 glycolipid 2-alpha-mannosyltransferase [Endogone sp. FLAS-F59071]